MQVFTCILSRSNVETCQVFLLYIMAAWTIACVKYFYLTYETYNNTVLLQYILHARRGHSLHFRANSRKPGTAYLIFSHLKPNFRVRYQLRQNPLKSSISPLFTPSKITTITPQNTLKPLKIKYSFELNQKIPYLTTK